MTSKVLDSQNVRLAVLWAGIYTAMTIGWALLGSLLGMYDERIRYSLAFNTGVLLPSLAVYAFAIRKMASGRAMTYRQRVLSGLVLTVFVTVLGPLYPLASTAISPHYFENAIRYTVDSGMMSEAEARQQLNLTTFIVQGIIAAPVFGLVLSAIAALFVRSHDTDRSVVFQAEC